MHDPAAQPAKGGMLPGVSVIIPARNEEKTLGETLAAIHRAREKACATAIEIIVVDNASTDRTAEIARNACPIRVIQSARLRAPCARNDGATAAHGHLLVFVDADTRIPENGLLRVLELSRRYDVGIFRIQGDSSNWRSRCWWFFWNTVRHLPLPRAKALPAFMFCTREAFRQLGPFDEKVVIGEEWPLTAGCYRRNRKRFVYDTATAAITSSRRMDLQPFGYVRTFVKYVWAILHRSGRLKYSDQIR